MTGARLIRKAPPLVLLCALVCAGCGSDGGGHGRQDPAATPTSPPAATASATATPTPAAPTVATVAFTVTSRSPLQAFQFRAAAPLSVGRPGGSADLVRCDTTAAGIFTKNGLADGTLVLSVASETDLIFPIDITCAYDLTSTPLGAADIDVGVEEVTAAGTQGDPSSLAVTVTVSVG